VGVGSVRGDLREVIVAAVSEIFYSIQGESLSQGYPTVFIRLAGCDLNCTYCDTVYARTGGESMSVDSIAERALSFSCPRVTITGGEPLMQPEACVALANLLAERGCDVQVETNGSRDISILPGHLRCIMDLKTPGSGESGATDMDNIDRLRPGDEVKFVLTSIDDFHWSRKIVESYRLYERAAVLFSPVPGMLDAETAAQALLEHRLNARLHLQLHKIIWPHVDRGV